MNISRLGSPSRAKSLLGTSTRACAVLASAALALGLPASQASAGVNAHQLGAHGRAVPAAQHAPASHDRAHWPTAHAKAFPGFDDQASLFNIFYDCHPAPPPPNPCPGHAQVSDVASPSEDGDALEINYESGNPAYMGAYAYIRLGNDDAATRYQINYDFMITNRAPVQALEFPMNNYIQNKRYQWAMQWENIGSGAPQWRLWNGSNWQPIGISDNDINPGTWYTLTIDGDIVQTANGPQVHYMDFIIHGVNHNLSQYTFPPTSEAGDGLVAAIQLDGDAHADPYQAFIDNAHFYWK